jgi:hypothetical protein
MPLNPKSLLNLKSARPGEVRNPSGKNGTEERYLTDIIRKTAREIEPGQKLTNGERLIQRLWESALGRNPNEVAWKLLVERCDGRMPLPVTGGDGEPLFPSVSEKTDGELDTLIQQLEARKGLVAKVKSGGNGGNGKK